MSNNSDTPAANTGAVQPEGREEVALPDAMLDVLKDLANESWREGHNEEPGNEVGYWLKEATQKLANLIRRAELTAAIRELQSVSKDAVLNRTSTAIALADRLTALTAELEKLEEKQ